MSSTLDALTTGCVVCGKETLQGCSACLKAGGLDWMKFCSVEHQNLIWKVHKRICGKAVFEWPVLKDGEFKEMWELRNVEYGNFDGETWAKSMADSASQLGAINKGAADPSKTAEQRRDIVFRNTLERASSPPEPSKLDNWNYWNRFVRTTAFRVKLTKGPRNSSPTLDQVRELLAEDPFGFIAFIMDPHAAPDAPYVDESIRLETALSRPGTNLFSIFQHRLLILVSIIRFEVLSSKGTRPFGTSVENQRLLIPSIAACGILGTQSTTKESGDPVRDLLARLFRSLGMNLRTA